MQPLNAARLFTSALREAAADNGELVALTDKTDASIASADRLLRALLDISKLDAGGMRPEFTDFPLQGLFDEFTTEFALTAEKKGLAFQTVPTSMWVRSDRGLLFSALQNIISNAVRYTDKGRIVVGARRRGRRVRIDVIDTGRGVPQERQSEIFLEFKRLERDRDAGGAGLGLAMVDRIAKLLDLELNLRSADRVGSRFSLTAARAAAVARPREASAAHASRSQASLAGLSAICIDNDDSVRDGTHALLTRWGCAADCFASDRDAIAALGPDASAPDLLLLDYQLDDGRTGFDALKSLEEFWGERPLTIMITASASGAPATEAAETGIPILAKPIEPGELRALINQLRRRAAE